MDRELYLRIQDMSRSELRAEIDRIKRLPDAQPGELTLLPERATTNWLDIQRAKQLKDELAQKGYVVNVQTETQALGILPALYYAVYVRERPASASGTILFHGESEEEAVCRAYIAVSWKILAGLPAPTRNPDGWNYRIVLERGVTGVLVWESVAVREVFYKENLPDSLSESEVSPAGETLEEFFRSWDLYLRAFQMPVLRFDRTKNKFLLEAPCATP